MVMPATADPVKSEDIVRDRLFHDMAAARVDDKGRLYLGKLGKEGPSGEVALYKVYQNSLGQIILDPLAIVPAHEVWLLKNPKAMKMVAQGWEDAKKGKVVKAREDYSKYADTE
jgi:hypothetical protein